MAKSKGEIITIQTLIKKGFNPLAYRYLCLTAHYRSKLNFSWENLKAAQSAIDNIYQKIEEIKEEKINPKKQSKKLKNYKIKFLENINNNLDTPKAMALMWKAIKDKSLSAWEKYDLISDFDKIFGLNLEKIKKKEIPEEVIILADKREIFRQKKDWKSADKIRQEIKKMDYQIEDTAKGPKIKKI